MEFFHSLGIKEDGTLWAWGRNSTGQLGVGTNEDHKAPTQIGSSKWKMISSGALHNLAVKHDGTLWAWGNDARGALGTPDAKKTNAPVQIIY